MKRAHRGGVRKTENTEMMIIRIMLRLVHLRSPVDRMLRNWVCYMERTMMPRRKENLGGEEVPNVSSVPALNISQATTVLPRTVSLSARYMGMMLMPRPKQKRPEEGKVQAILAWTGCPPALGVRKVQEEACQEFLLPLVRSVVVLGPNRKPQASTTQMNTAFMVPLVPPVRFMEVKQMSRPRQGQGEEVPILHAILVWIECTMMKALRALPIHCTELMRTQKPKHELQSIRSAQVSVPELVQLWVLDLSMKAREAAVVSPSMSHLLKIVKRRKHRLHEKCRLEVQIPDLQGMTKTRNATLSSLQRLLLLLVGFKCRMILTHRLVMMTVVWTRGPMRNESQGRGGAYFYCFYFLLVEG